MNPLNAALVLADELSFIPDRRPRELSCLVEDINGPCAYYRYFYELAPRLMPFNDGRRLRVLEIGTYRGVSAAAWAYQGADVLTIDINPDAKAQVAHLGIDGIRAVTANADDPVVAQKLLDEEKPFEVLFIDGNHTFNNFWIEYIRYRRLVRDGWLIFADDLELDMATRDMQIAWGLVPEIKHPLHHLHHTGFGVIQKSDVIRPPSWEEAARIAGPMMEAARASRVKP